MRSENISNSRQIQVYFVVIFIWNGIVAASCQKSVQQIVKRISRCAWLNIIVCWAHAVDQAIHATANICPNRAMISM